MRYFCPACGSAHTMPDEEIPSTGTTVDCGKCGFSIKVKPPRRKAKSASTADLPADPEQKPSGDEEKEPKEKVELDTTEPDFQAVEEPRPGISRELRIPYPGCCRSGARFRFRDLFFALQAPLDLRKTLASAAGVLAGSVLLILILWLASLTKSQTGGVIGLIFGSLLFCACMYMGLGVAIKQADREMIHGGRLPLSEGIDFVKSHLVNVVGFPFLFVAGIVALGTVIAIFHLMARIPYAGPMLFGLTYGAVFTMGVLAILIGVLFVFAEFSYIPAAGKHGLLGLAAHMWRLARRKPGRYALHLLVSYSVALVLAIVLVWILVKALWLIGMVGGLVGGGEFPKILLSQPGGLFPFLEMLFPTGLGAGIGQGWQFTIAGWLVFVMNMAVFSLVTGFLGTYLLAAGAVNYHLLTQDEEVD